MLFFIEIKGIIKKGKAVMKGLFSKRKDILAVILTSADTDRLVRCYQTLLNSKKQCSMDIEIMINTLDETYPQKVYDAFKGEKKVKIYESDSNGTSARGGNRVLDHFRTHKGRYNYLMCVDGDDFFYPTAFECFEKLFEYTPDIIGLQAQDTLKRKQKNPKNEFYHWVQDDVYLNSWNDYELNLNLEFPKDISKPVSEQYPPDRILFMSERLLKTEKDLYYPEDLRVFSDYAFSVFAYEKALNNGYSYIHFSNSYTYIYDRLNEQAVTKTHNKLGQTQNDMNRIFPEIVKESASKCDNGVDFRIIPFFKLGPPKMSFSSTEKINFIKENLIF